MKRITILLAFLIAGLAGTYAQDSGLDYNDLKGKLDKSNKSLDNPKKNGDAKFWLERARLFQDIADVSTQFLRTNMAVTELKLMYKDPKQVKKEEDNKETYVYEHFEATFKNGKLSYWKETAPIVPNPLEEALNCYKKASDLDADKKNEKKISEGLKSLKTLYLKKALNCYNLEDLACSFAGFKTIVDINEMKQVNVIDTGIMYNAGLTAVQIEKYDDAIKLLQKVADMKYTGDPMLFTYLKRAYFAKGDTVTALNSLKQGIALFPHDISIIIELINYYISTGDKKAALEYLAKAKENDPKNRSFYYAEGALYDKMAGAIDSKIAEMDDKKKTELTQVDENKKAEFKKTGNNVQKYKPIEDKYNKIKQQVEDKYKSEYDSLNALHDDYQSKAVSQYKEAVNVDPTYFDAYYNLGVLYFNNGVRLSDQAGKEVDDKKYEAKKNASEEEFKKAIPVMENAYEVNEKTKATTPESANEIAKNRKTTLDVLKTLYYRLKMNDQFDRIKKLQDSAPANQ